MSDEREPLLSEEEAALHYAMGHGGSGRGLGNAFHAGAAWQREQDAELHAMQTRAEELDRYTDADRWTYHRGVCDAVRYILRGEPLGDGGEER